MFRSVVLIWAFSCEYFPISTVVSSVHFSFWVRAFTLSRKNDTLNLTSGEEQIPVFRVDSVDAAAAKSLQSCPTLCDPIDSSPSGSTVPGILQARTLERVAISFSNA